MLYWFYLTSQEEKQGDKMFFDDTNTGGSPATEPLIDTDKDEKDNNSEDTGNTI